MRQAVVSVRGKCTKIMYKTKSKTKSYKTTYDIIRSTSSEKSSCYR